jgi:monoterpene epsilon-lactone hydrolase
LIEIQLDGRDAVLLPRLHQYFKSFWSDTSQGLRAHYNRFIASTPIVDGAVFRSAADLKLPGLWCEPPSADAERAILYLHGGAYTMGNAESYRGFVSQIASRAHCSAFILDYPLAPEASIPVALDLTCMAVDRLIAIYPRIAIVGDSAGGGLTLATLANLRDRKRVAAAVLFSPWTDLTLAGRSVHEKANTDVLLDPAKLTGAAKAYVGTLPLDDPRASPLFSIPRDLPPILIQVGSEEVLLDDARRYAVEARKTGASVTLEVWQGMHHVFQLDVKILASSRCALGRVAAFLRSGR